MLRTSVFHCFLAGCMGMVNASAQEVVVFRPIDANATSIPSLACLDAYDRVDDSSARLSMSSDILRLCAANEDVDGDGCDKELKRVVTDQSKFRDALRGFKKECRAK
ncbi:hypothetical protein EET67_17680 [Pseudaminobacter arsenicus]|uniref:UrcA family protein n=1 Tax=Borborobacter arsenicus TaxID=1851146 RepID=A0A432V2I1_9HYPH|nr:hypothetical protein [Pseudaminobacter arsenicus]RUM96381.1 hypothetical protein EET67_17680 [Pseudaminobacter arsenicus]